MENVPLHRLYRHFSELPYSLRVLYTMTLLILGTAYLFAMIYLFHSYSGKDGNPRNLTYEDVVIAYSGSGKDSRLESALRGSMSVMLPKDELTVITSWVQKGADRAAYESQIRPLMDTRCMACHDGSNPHLVNLNGYDNLKKATEKDTGTPLFTLVRVSHIHLFGLTFIFFLVGTIFSHAYLRPVWLKLVIVGLPFLSIAVDIFSWYITKYYHPFAWVVMASGGVTGMCFGFMWVVSVWQMWFGRAPAQLLAQDDTANVG